MSSLITCSLLKAELLWCVCTFCTMITSLSEIIMHMEMGIGEICRRKIALPFSSYYCPNSSLFLQSAPHVNASWTIMHFSVIFIRSTQIGHRNNSVQAGLFFISSHLWQLLAQWGAKLLQVLCLCTIFCKIDSWGISVSSVIMMSCLWTASQALNNLVEVLKYC